MRHLLTLFLTVNAAGVLQFDHAQPVSTGLSKCACEVQWFRDEDGRVAALANGDPVAEGDRIQLSYNGPGGWVRLVGMDGTRDVRDYGVWQVAHHEFQPAPFSLEIDGKPGPERFWLEWTSEEPLDTGDTGLVDTENGHQVADFDVPWPPTGGNGVEIRGVSTFEKPGR